MRAQHTITRSAPPSPFFFPVRQVWLLRMQRRLLRYAAAHLEAAPDFTATESLRTLAQNGKAGQKVELAQGLGAERTHREIRLTRGPNSAAADFSQKVERYECVIPGELVAPAFACRIRLDLAAPAAPADSPDRAVSKAILRAWKPGDRVRLRYSSGPRKVKEVLERMKVTGTDRSQWPVLEVAGRIVWMRGVEVEPDLAIRLRVEAISPDAG